MSSYSPRVEEPGLRPVHAAAAPPARRIAAKQSPGRLQDAPAVRRFPFGRRAPPHLSEHDATAHRRFPPMPEDRSQKGISAEGNRRRGGEPEPGVIIPHQRSNRKKRREKRERRNSLGEAQKYFI